MRSIVLGTGSFPPGHAMLAISTVYINLASRPDRRAFMEDQFDAIGLRARRFEAITPADIDAADIARYCGPSLPRPLAPSELACAMSHMQCWQTDAWTLVIEDDAVLSPRLPTFLRAFAEAPPPDIDLVQLEAYMKKPVRILPSTAEVAGVRLHRFRTAIGGACYLLSPGGARYLLAHPRRFAQPVDITLFRAWLGPARGLRSVLSDPALAMQIRREQPRHAIARSDLEPTRVERMKRPSDSILNALDHLWHLPQGITTKRIHFDGNA